METDRPDGVRISSLSLGPHDADRTLVCLGGWVLGSAVWLLLAEELTALGWRVVLIDHRGCADSPCDPALISRDRMVGDLDAVLADHSVGEGAVLVGASQGALLALHAELARPARFDALVLIGGMPGWPLDGGTADFARALVEDREAALARFAAAALPEPDCLHLRARLLTLLRAADADATLEQLATLAGPALDAELRGISTPTLLLHGAEDVVVPVRHSETLAVALPSARLQVLEGAGHLPAFTRPRTVAAAIVAFVGR